MTAPAGDGGKNKIQFKTGRWITIDHFFSVATKCELARSDETVPQQMARGFELKKFVDAEAKVINEVAVLIHDIIVRS